MNTKAPRILVASLALIGMVGLSSPAEAAPASAPYYVERDCEALDLARYEVALNAARYRQHDRLLLTDHQAP